VFFMPVSLCHPVRSAEVVSAPATGEKGVAMADELHYLSATEAIAQFEARTLSPLELMRAVIARAERVEPEINAFATTFFERALEQARRAEDRYARPSRRRRPLEGIPLAVKDESAIAGQPAASGSLILRDHVDTRTSPSIERLLRAGAIVHARSTAPEFSCATVTHSRLRGVTRNPWNLEYTPGGSSGGSAASLAAGTTTLASGSDIAGSIRIPASCCGVVGFKPPYGRVPEDPPFNLDSYNHEGPLARTVADCALMENLMAGPHPRDIATLRPKLRIPPKLGGVDGWRIACSLDFGYVEVDPEVRENTRAALEVFRTLGCRVEEVELGWTPVTLDAALSHLGQLFGNWILHEHGGRLAEMSSYTRSFAEFARTTTAADELVALNVAGEMYAGLAPILERFDVLVCPTTAIAAVPADYDPARGGLRINGVEVEPILGWVMTYPFNMLSRCPVMSVPSGRARNGVPTGIQIVGRTYDDVRVFRAAAAFERASGWLDAPGRRPSL
jgi:Asp-tRNA(Asn)/Glu-tRNA(Gln) amidotransferase A subunit family amidase